MLSKHFILGLSYRLGDELGKVGVGGSAGHLVRRELEDVTMYVGRVSATSGVLTALVWGTISESYQVPKYVCFSVEFCSTSKYLIVSLT